MVSVWGARYLSTIRVYTSLRRFQVNDDCDTTTDNVSQGMGDITTMTVDPGSVVTLRYTVNEDCDLRWKFRTEKGDIGFGVQRKQAIQNVMCREEVSAYHLEHFDSDAWGNSIGDNSGDNVVSISSDAFVMGAGLPEIQINDEEDKFVEENRRKSRTNSLLVC